jgi:hypothetical protein
MILIVIVVILVANNQRREWATGNGNKNRGKGKGGKGERNKKTFFSSLYPLTADVPLEETPRPSRVRQLLYLGSHPVAGVPPVVGSGVRHQDPSGSPVPQTLEDSLSIALDRLGEAPLYEGRRRGLVSPHCLTALPPL